ncbi:MAG: hypothetical protein ACOCRZ_02385 [Halothermotrichaceae bacterium]
MKKLLFMLLVVCLMITVVGCGNDDSTTRGTIQGTVTFETGNVNGMKVAVYDFEVYNHGPEDLQDYFVDQTTINNDEGTYQISDLPVGVYFVIAYIDENENNQLDVSEETYEIYSFESDDPKPVIIDSSDTVTGIDIEIVLN